MEHALQEYARLLARVGLNIQKGQRLPLAVLIQPVGGFIGDQQLYLGAKSKSDGHPLGHAAGQLEGILFQNGFRLCKPHLRQLFAGKGISLRRRNAQLPDAVKELPANASGWVKKFMPVLRDVHDLPAQHGPEFFPLRQSVSAKGYLTGDQAHISGQHIHDRLRDQRLYCKIGFSKFPSESTFLHSPARKNYVRFLMKRCAIALESGGNIYNHILI